MDKILEIWPSLAEFARDLSLPYTTVASWRARGIPARRARQISEAAARRGETLSVEDVLTLSSALEASSEGISVGAAAPDGRGAATSADQDEGRGIPPVAAQ